MSTPVCPLCIQKDKQITELRATEARQREYIAALVARLRGGPAGTKMTVVPPTAEQIAAIDLGPKTEVSNPAQFITVDVSELKGGGGGGGGSTITNVDGGTSTAVPTLLPQEGVYPKTREKPNQFDAAKAKAEAKREKRNAYMREYQARKAAQRKA